MALDHQKIIQKLNTFFAYFTLIILTFSSRIAALLGVGETSVEQYNFWFLFPLISTIILIVTAKLWYFDKKDTNFYDVGALLSAAVTLTSPVLGYYFWSIRSMQWEYQQDGIHPNSVIFLIPIIMLVTSAISQSFRVVETVPKQKILVYGVFTFIVAIVSLPTDNPLFSENLIRTLILADYVAIVFLIDVQKIIKRKNCESH